MGRSKGSGYLFKRGKYFHLRTKVCGMVKVIPLHTSNKTEAERKAEELMPLLEAKTREEITLHVGQARKLISSASIPLDQAWEKYYKSSKRHETCKETESNHKTRFEKFISWLGKNHPGFKSLAQVSEEIAAEYAQSLWDDGMSAKTFNDHIAALRIVFRTIAKEAGLAGNPFVTSNIEKKTEEHHTRRELSEAELLKVLEAPDSPELKMLNKEEMKVLLSLGAWAGLRLKDAALLKWNAVNFDMGQISVVPSKTRRNKRPVIIPLHPALEGELNKAKKWADDTEYVLSKVAERYGRNPSGIVKDIGRLFRHAGIATKEGNADGARRKLSIAVAGFHSLRHSFVSFCAKKGIPLAIVQALVGHGNPAMTRHYTHLGADSTRQAIAALPSLNSITSQENANNHGEVIKMIIQKLPTLDANIINKIAKLIGVPAGKLN